MPSQSWLKLAAACLALIICVAAVQAWRADRRDRAQLTAELATTRQLLADADARQHDRDAQLAQTLAALAAEKRAVVTPAQILRELPKQLPLPTPITLQIDQASSARGGARFSAPPAASGSVGATLGSPAANASTGATLASGVGTRLASPVATASPSDQKPPGVILPAADLKPLYDFTLDCQACQAKLSAAQSDLADERQKTAALAKERDDALRVARGGSAWRRVGRAAKWFLIGAAAGAIAGRAAH